MDTYKADLTSQTLAFFQNVQMPMSFIQVLLILGLVGVCAYVGQLKIGLVVSFFTITYWAYVSNEVWILETATGSFYGMLAAITMGMVVAFIGFVGILQERH